MKPVIIAVIDGMGGGIGIQLVSQLRQELGSQAEIIALGTNSLATSLMIKAGASRGATGENAIRVCIKEADYVIGPLGIIIPDALMGEISPAIAQLIASASCPKLLLPVSNTHVEIIGLSSRPLSLLIKDAIGRLKGMVSSIPQSKGKKNEEH